MKRHGNPHSLVTDKLRSYGAAMKVVGNADKRETGRWLNNRAENSHQPFRRRERAMIRFRRMRTLQNARSLKKPIAALAEEWRFGGNELKVSEFCSITNQHHFAAFAPMSTFARPERILICAQLCRTTNMSHLARDKRGSTFSFGQLVQR